MPTKGIGPTEVDQKGRVAIRPGTELRELPTPALLMDLDGMERNLLRMANFFRNSGPKLRPHFKAHQVLSLAKRQLEAGAIGLTCARLDQAETLVRSGNR